MACMNMKWKLVIKYAGCNKNILDIGIVWSNGNMEHIARAVLPDDGQIGDNVICGDEIRTALNKRIRKSV